MGRRSRVAEAYVRAAERVRRGGRVERGGEAGTEMGDGTERLGRTRGRRRRKDRRPGKQGQARTDARGLSPSTWMAVHSLSLSLSLSHVLSPFPFTLAGHRPAHIQLIVRLLAICSCSRTRGRSCALGTTPLLPYHILSCSMLAIRAPHLATELQPCSCAPSRVSTSVRSGTWSAHPLLALETPHLHQLRNESIVALPSCFFARSPDKADCPSPQRIVIQVPSPRRRPQSSLGTGNQTYPRLNRCLASLRLPEILMPAQTIFQP
ncbi:hypothetical protein BC628DRAFT_874311 [Trametes gibbosa]|nr:hypothetical protein BC628DRAFT_874311 [Trametes gibbosa]